MRHTLQYEPPWRLWQFEDERHDDSREEDLEGNGETPGDRIGIEKAESEVEPVTDHNASRNERPL